MTSRRSYWITYIVNGKERHTCSHCRKYSITDDLPYDAEPRPFCSECGSRMNIDKSMADRLRALLKEAHITQKQLAKILCISQASVNFYVNGVHGIPEELLQDIADALDITIEELRGADDERED